MPHAPFVVVHSGTARDPDVRERLLSATGADKVTLAPDFAVSARAAFSEAGFVVAWSGNLTNEPELRRDFPGAEPGPAAIVAALLRTAAPGEDRWIRELWGEFALAAYDPRIRSLWLVRDRIGVHPLFITRNTTGASAGFAAATAISTLLAASGTTPRPRLDQAARFLGTHYRHYEHDGRATAFEGIERVPPGTALLCDNAGIKEHRYWAAPFALATPPDAAAAAEAVASLLEDAVRRRVTDLDARTAAFALSSGMDSSSVLALASRSLGTGCAVYTTTFPGWAENEEHDAAAAAAPYGRWQGLPIAPIPDFLAAAQDLHRVHDEPVCTVTWYWDHLVQAQAARAGARGFFGGLGGDELFAGEYEHFFFRFADIDAAGDNATLMREVDAWQRLHSSSRYPKDEALVRETWRRMRGENGETRPDADRYGRSLLALSPELRAVTGGPLATENPFPDYLRNRLWQDLSRETTLPCARAAWMNAAACGNDLRYPFLDHRLVELAFSLPGEWKIRDGVNKVILRRAMKGILPDDVTGRTTKTGWTSPAYLWFQGPALDGIEENNDWLTRPLYDQAARRSLIAEHRAGRADHSMLFWQMVALEAWWRRWWGDRPL